jgi:hypothetical protein
MKKIRGSVKKTKFSIKKSEEGAVENNMGGKMLLVNQRCFPLKTTGQKVNLRYEEVLESRKRSKKHFCLVRIPEPEVMDEQFDVNVDGIYYRVFVNYKHSVIRWNEIVSYDYDGKGRVLLKNPAIDAKLAEGLQKFVRDSDTSENLKINSIKFFAENEIKRIKEQRLKSKPKTGTRGRTSEDYLRVATLWSIKNHKPNKENRTETVRRGYKMFGEKSQSEKAFVKSVMTKWTSIRTLYLNEKRDKKITSDLKTFAKNHFKLARNADKQKVKRNQEGKI